MVAPQQLNRLTGLRFNRGSQPTGHNTSMPLGLHVQGADAKRPPRLFR
jgi:hypothetical protein